MLFNAYDFLFGFLPLVLMVHAVAVRRGTRAAMGWLVVASLFFYGWWYAPYLLLLLGSVAFNFVLGQWLGDEARSDQSRSRLLTLGVTANLLLLGWFKYAGFFAANLERAFGLDLNLPVIALPLAISFFTFQQVAYLVDASRGLAREHDWLDYTLFVSFFPQLVAGPIVHHGEVLPQFRTGRAPTAQDRSVGLTLFLVGLAKKVIVADSLASSTDVVYTEVALGRDPTVVRAWAGVLSYHFQLYFDFSGYSDMAIGLGRLFGIKLPANFDAPYRANDIGDFWRRWHMTLSRFLRDYVYIPLGGNRRGEGRRLFNLFATMFLGGLWHGAGWTYVIWGGLHGLYLVIIELWRRASGGFGKSRAGVVVARTLTWVALLVGWTLFRAADLDDAWRLFCAMWGFTSAGFGGFHPLLWTTFAVLLWFTQSAPTSQRWLEAHDPVLEMRGMDEIRWSPKWTWAPTRKWALLTGLAGFACIPLLERADAFLYWNF